MARTPIQDYQELPASAASQEIAFNESAIRNDVAGGTFYFQDFDLVATPTGLTSTDKSKVWKIAAVPTGQWLTDVGGDKLGIWSGSGWLYMDPKGATPRGCVMGQVAAGATKYARELMAYSPTENAWYPIQPRLTDDGSDVVAEHWTGGYRNGGKLYRKSLDFGTLPNATTKAVAHGITGLILTDAKAPILRFSFSNGTIIRTLDNGIDAYIDTTNITIGTDVDYTTYSAHVEIEDYSKT